MPGGQCLPTGVVLFEVLQRWWQGMFSLFSFLKRKCVRTERTWDVVTSEERLQ